MQLVPLQPEQQQQGIGSFARIFDQRCTNPYHPKIVIRETLAHNQCKYYACMPMTATCRVNSTYEHLRDGALKLPFPESDVSRMPRFRWILANGINPLLARVKVSHPTMKFFLNHLKKARWITYNKIPSLAIMGHEIADGTLDSLYKRLNGDLEMMTRK